MENSGVITLQKAPAEFSVMTPKRPSMPRILSRQLSWPSFMGEDTVPPIRANGESASSDSGEVVQFDVFERQGFDRIMQTMGNSTSDQEEIAKCICETLQTVSSLSCDRYVLHLGVSKSAVLIYPSTHKLIPFSRYTGTKLSFWYAVNLV